MPDTEHDARPADWSDAFAALPMETPPTGGWQRLQRALDADTATPAPRRRHWPIWLAAAAIGAIALVPALRTSDDAAPTSGAADLAAHKRIPVDTSRPPMATSKRPETRVATHDTTAPTIDDATPASTGSATVENRARPRVAPVDPQDAQLRQQVAALQAESAQLEALLELARDDRVATASSAALAVEFDRRIGRIDASLSQPGLADAERASLWQARVSAMRELAGIETTQRWLSASGERYDGALVSVD